MTQENYEKATELLEAIERLEGHKVKVETLLPPFAEEYPSETKTYVAAMTKKIDVQINQLKKEFEKL